MSKITDEWRTPDWLFKELDQEFNFSIDLCATKENTKCDFWCDDYLLNTVDSKDNTSWDLRELIDVNEIYTGFMNPPYSRPTKTNPGINAFIEKAWEDSKYKHLQCRKCKGKGYKELSGPTFPSCILVFDRRLIFTHS